MSRLPPYAPPTEEEFTALHARLSAALDRLSRIGEAVHGPGTFNPYISEAYHDELERKAVEALRLARQVRAVVR